MLSRLLLAVTLCVSPIAAIADALTADATVENMTNEVIAVVTEAKEKEATVEEFMPQLEDVMLSYADFNWIASQIMGKHRRGASREQVEAFATKFRSVMISTYAKSFLSYNGERVVTYPVPERFQGERRVPVRQEVEGIGGGLDVLYTMGQKRTGDWVMLNLQVNGVNLGQTYNQQFDRMMNDLGSVDEVISAWGQ